MPKVILDLCGGTGAWSRPYKDAGYDVHIVDPQEWIFGPGMTGDVRLYEKPVSKVQGVLASPPCTHFSASGARWWKSKGDAALLEGLSVVDACLRIVYAVQPAWWAMENPVGRLKDFIGKPKMTFQPWEYGDVYTKRTCLWGEFTPPVKTPAVPMDPKYIANMSPSDHRALKRSITPPGFAQAFFDANP